MGAKETFVTINDNADGIGKLIAAKAEYADVEFFDSPNGPRLIKVRVRLDSVRRGHSFLGRPGFSCSSQIPGSGKLGRVDELVAGEQSGNEEHYSVNFPNGRNDRIPVSRLFVRWNHPMCRPD